MTTYHRSESIMNKGFGDASDRLKEDFHFYVWESLMNIHNFQHLFPYFHHILKNMYIFATRFLLISVMKLAGGAIYYLFEYMCIISHL